LQNGSWQHPRMHSVVLRCVTLRNRPCKSRLSAAGLRQEPGFGSVGMQSIVRGARVARAKKERPLTGLDRACPSALSWSGAVAFDPKRPSCGSATLGDIDLRVALTP